MELLGKAVIADTTTSKEGLSGPPGWGFERFKSVPYPDSNLSPENPRIIVGELMYAGYNVWDMKAMPLDSHVHVLSDSHSSVEISASMTVQRSAEE